MPTHSLSIALFAALAMSILTPKAHAADPPNFIVHSGQSVAFLGASISEFGWNSPTGYIKRFVNTLTANGVNIVPIPAGRSGNTSRDMLARLDRDVIEKKPTWVTIDAGGNDVWHGDVNFADYMKYMTAIVDKSQAAGIKVMIQTCTPIGEDPKNEFNPKLDIYNTFLRYLAEQKHCLLADLNADSVKILQTKTNKDNLLTTDGVHMNNRGNKVMAMGLLRAFGATDEQIALTMPPVPQTAPFPVQTVTASSAEDDAHAAKNAADGNENTRWASLATDDQAITLDLGTPQRIGLVHLVWEEAFAAAYKLQVSDDGTNWREVANVTDGKGGEELRVISPTTARFVRLQGVKRGSAFGYSLWELAAYPPEAK